MNDIIKWHKKQYPLMEKVDLYKLLYQSEFAGGHMITNADECYNYLLAESKSDIEKKYEILYEYISDKYVRVNLRPYNKFHLDIKYLWNAFVSSSNSNHGNINHFKEILANNLISTNDLMPHHHSATYRDNYHPSYRVIAAEFITDELRLIQCLDFLKNIDSRNPTIVALEGKCASGKTTLCQLIKKHLNISIINTDDFFKPFNDKSLKCWETTKESIDYYRLAELLHDIKIKKQINYTKFDCQTGKFTNCILPYTNIIILEGVYSYHPYFKHLIDYVMFLKVDSNVQDMRLKERKLYRRFIEEWIPQENAYYEDTHIEAICNIII